MANQMCRASGQAGNVGKDLVKGKREAVRAGVRGNGEAEENSIVDRIWHSSSFIVCTQVNLPSAGHVSLSHLISN